jgi:DNA-binding PadR family transcriptional regulator
LANLSIFDAFLLTLVKEGVNTVYLLRDRARLSVGATTPALHRLVHKGLAQKGDASSRGRIDYRLTSKGRTALFSFQQQLGSDAPSLMTADVADTLRLCALAVKLRRVDVARLILDRAVEILGQRAEQRPRSAPHSKNAPDLAAVYSEFLSVLDRRRVASEIKALLSVQASIPNRKSRPKG